MEEKFTAVEEVCDEVQALLRLESVVKLDDEGVRYLLHDISLNFSIVYLVRSDDEILLECLHRINLLVIFLLRHIYFTKRATSYHFEQLEIIDVHFSPLAADDIISIGTAITLIIRRNRGH